MKIALIGGTGFVGAAILEEALARGHDVTALARDPAKYTQRERLQVAKADVQDAAQVAAAVEGSDAVISAFNPGWTVPDIGPLFTSGHRAIMQGTKQSGVKRILVVGGAGSLYVAPGKQLIDTPDFPKDIYEGANAAREALNEMRGEQELEWTFLSPPVFLAPGERTGRYRTGGEQPLMEGDKPAGISVRDMAQAILDEIGAPKHIRARFTVASA
jgi:putative NADH-flavin reductase